MIPEQCQKSPGIQLPLSPVRGNNHRLDGEMTKVGSLRKERGTPSSVLRDAWIMTNDETEPSGDEVGLRPVEDLWKVASFSLELEREVARHYASRAESLLKWMVVLWSAGIALISLWVGSTIKMGRSLGGDDLLVIVLLLTEFGLFIHLVRETWRAWHTRPYAPILTPKISSQIKMDDGLSPDVFKWTCFAVLEHAASRHTGNEAVSKHLDEARRTLLSAFVVIVVAAVAVAYAVA